MTSSTQESNSNIKKAVEGNIVEFKRDGNMLLGEVLSVLENSVVVNLRVMESFDSLKLEHDRTVVNHKNYSILY